MKFLFINHHRRSKTVLRAGTLARYLVERGHQIDLMCISDDNRGMISENDEHGVHYIETPDLLPGNLRSGWDPWSMVRRAMWLREKGDYDLIHAFETRPATIYPIKLLLRKKPVPLVVDWIDWWGRGGLISEQRPRWYQLLFEGLETYYEEHFRTMADCSTVISHALAERAKSLHVEEDAIFWIPNGAPVETFHMVPKDRFRRKYELPQDALILGFSALDVTIDAKLVFQATRIAAESRQDVMLIMTGNRKDEMLALAQEMEISSRFRHFGNLSYDEELAQVLSCADIFLLPFSDKIANRGRWPNKIGDYMAMGRPTISNPVGEMEILFNGEEIGLLAEESPEDFASKILDLLKDESLRLRQGINARRVAEEKFSWNSVAAKAEMAYKEAFARFRPSTHA